MQIRQKCFRKIVDQDMLSAIKRKVRGHSGLVQVDCAVDLCKLTASAAIAKRNNLGRATSLNRSILLHFPMPAIARVEVACNTSRTAIVPQGESVGDSVGGARSRTRGDMRSSPTPCGRGFLPKLPRRNPIHSNSTKTATRKLCASPELEARVAPW